MAIVFITGSTDGLGKAAALSLLDNKHQVYCTPDQPIGPPPSANSRPAPKELRLEICEALLRPGASQTRSTQ